jgi:uncharacterized protein YihD (DUF1040 family)
MSEYTILPTQTEEEALEDVKRIMEIIHECESFWGLNPELDLNQVSRSIADTLKLNDLVALATMYLMHYVRNAEDIT